MITDALPITIPSMVNRLRNLLAFRVLRAMPTVSAMGRLLAMDECSGSEHRVEFHGHVAAGASMNGTFLDEQSDNLALQQIAGGIGNACNHRDT